MVATHGERFEATFWAFFDAHVGRRLPPRAVMIDLGCGPGLLLRDLGERYPDAVIYGYDVTPAMIAYGRQLVFKAASATFAIHDVVAQPLPLAAATVNLASMSSVLHVFDEPLPTLAEIRRVLVPGGIFLLNDWIRQPLSAYLAYRRDVMKESGSDSLRRAFVSSPCTVSTRPRTGGGSSARPASRFSPRPSSARRTGSSSRRRLAERRGQARNAFIAVTRAGVPPKR